MDYQWNSAETGVQVHIRRFAAHEWPTYRDLRLRALAESPDAYGRTLAEEEAWPDDRWSGRLAAGAGSDWDLPLLAEVGGEPVGLAWGRIDPSQPGVAALYQMWVVPSHRRHGIGQMLLEAVITWARAKNARYLELGVTVGNSSATRLYQRAGFEPVGPPQPFREGSALLGQPMRLRL